MYTGQPLTQSDYTRSCINTIVLLKMSTKLLETCIENSNKHIIEETVCQVGHLPELYEGARSEKYKLYCTACHCILTCFLPLVYPVSYFCFSFFSFRSSSSCLHLLPLLILSVFPSVTCFITGFLRKV